MRLMYIKENSVYENYIIKKCVDYLFKNGGEAISCGKHQILDSDIYANVFEYDTKRFEENSWEAHKEYADLQILLTGSEKILVSCISNMKQSIYHSESDYQECQGNAEHVIEMSPLFGLLLMPEDAHMPGVILGDGSANVKKCVFKIPIKYF